MGFMDAMRAMGEASDFVTAEIRAAQELGHNTAEYQWVQEQVMEAQVAKMGRGAQEQIGVMGEQFVAMMEQQLANTTDAEQKAEIERQIAEYRQSLAESAAETEELEPGVEHNIELLEKYQDRIERIQKLYQELDNGQQEEAAN
jgi:DNA repair exonuclease SbcCD ATPase subunit